MPPPPPDTLLPPPEALFDLELRGELGLLETEARGTGLVRPMLLLPPVLPPEETVIVTGEEEDGDEAVFTMFTKKNKESQREYG